MSNFRGRRRGGRFLPTGRRQLGRHRAEGSLEGFFWTGGAAGGREACGQLYTIAIAIAVATTITVTVTVTVTVSVTIVIVIVTVPITITTTTYIIVGDWGRGAAWRGAARRSDRAGGQELAASFFAWSFLRLGGT